MKNTVMSLNPGRVELEVLSTSVLSRRLHEPQIMDAVK